MRKLLATFLFASAVAACTPAVKHSTFVKVDQVSLGKVVVYRNGVAFYERRAQVSGGKLTISVPRDRVDDFLKSLTVVDAKTHTPLPASFPRQQSESGPFIEMTLDIPMAKGPGETADVVLTYVTEAPVWKPSYRIAISDTGKVMLEGWAIVDNTSGEDWKDVMVGVGSSSALSFRYDLWSVRTVQRETLQVNEQFAVAPPNAVSPYGGSGEGQQNQNMVAELGDEEIRRPAGHPENIDDALAKRDFEAAEEDLDEADYGGDAEYSGVATGSIGGRGGGRGDSASAAPSPAMTRNPGSRPTKPKDAAKAARVAKLEQERSQLEYKKSKVSEGDRKVMSLAPQLIKNRNNLIIEGYSDPSEAGSEQRSLDRANIVKMQLIDAGVPPAQIRVVNKGAIPGQRAGVRMITEAPSNETAGADGSTKPDDTAESPVGESHFQSEMPMTVAKGTSVMVSMVRAQTDGEQVYLYDAESERGNDRFAFKAVRLHNPTDSTLETGPVTVYGDDRYIGEGLTEPIPPKANVVVPFALDRQIVVDRDDSTDNQVARLVTLQRGILTAEVQHIKKTKLTITSRLHTPTKVYIRHTTEKGWLLLDAPETYERLGDAHLFEISIAGGETKTVEISEATPLTRTLDLSSPTTLDMMKVFVESAHPSPELKKQLTDLLAIHREVIDTGEKIVSLRDRMVEYRERMDELNEQIISLRKVKTATSLLRNLQEKMKDISDRVQKTTIGIVDEQEKLMLAKVRFQDSLAELSLPDAAASLAIKP